MTDTTPLTDTRTDFATADADRTRFGYALSALTDHHARLARGAVTEGPARPTRAFERVLEPAPGADPSARRAELAYLSAPLFSEGPDVAESALDRARRVAAESSTATDEPAPVVVVDTLEAHLGGGDEPTPWTDVVDAYAAALATNDPATVAGLIDVVTVLVDGARAARDDAVLAAEGGDADPLDTFVAANDDLAAALATEPVVFLPVRMETRFVRPATADVDRPELWVRVYPDEVHIDTHEPNLTDEEVAWGRHYWAALWFASHPSFEPADPWTDDDGRLSESHVAATVSDPSRVAVVRALDPRAFPDDPDERKDAVRERSWGRLIDRFGRERAAHVRVATRPEEASVLEGPVPDRTGFDAPDLTFGRVDRKAESWTRPPTARLLPDRWTLYGTWTDGERSSTVAVRGAPIREPLVVGPTPEAVASALRSVHGPASTPTEMESTSAIADIEWMLDFEAAERAGMAMRVTLANLNLDPGTPSVEITDGRFETLAVAGVKASLDPERTADAMADLLDAHHYTEGLGLVAPGTPTNNAETPTGFDSQPDAATSVGIETGRPVVAPGDHSDGDVLARMLGVAPVDAEPHVFGHVAGADGRLATDAWHLNSALWPATLGYYLGNMLLPNDRTSAAEGFSLWPTVDDHLQEDVTVPWLASSLAGIDAVGRHYVEHVRPGGHSPTLRVGRQPYGVLPATADGEAVALPWAAAGTEPSDGTDTDDDENGDGDGGRDGAGDDGRPETGDEGDGSTPRFDPSTVPDPEEVARWLAGVDVDVPTLPVGWDWIDVPTGEFADLVTPETAVNLLTPAAFAERYPVADAASVYDAETVAAVYPIEAVASAYSPAELAAVVTPRTARSVLSAEELVANYPAERLLAAGIDPESGASLGGAFR